jgi:polysaccharide export outer membrane protein
VQRIRPDGKVSFEGLGEFVVAGKTPSQVAEMLGKKVEDLYKLIGEYPIEVRVVDYRSKVFYVMGQVFSPGAKIHTGRETVLLSVAEAMPNPMAAKSKVRVIRPSADPSINPKAFKVNFKRMITHGEISQDVLLQEGDVIYVPPTILAAIALKIEEFIRPLARAFSGAYMLQNPPASRKESSGSGRSDYRY